MDNKYSALWTGFCIFVEPKIPKHDAAFNPLLIVDRPFRGSGTFGMQGFTIPMTVKGTNIDIFNLK